MPGWCCCDQWEKWEKWDAEDQRVGPASLRDQTPAAAQPSERARVAERQRLPADRPRSSRPYLERAEDHCDGSKPIVSNATDAGGPGQRAERREDARPVRLRAARRTGCTDTKNGGAFGFATEIGPGRRGPADREPARRCCRRISLWPMNEFWNFHAGGDEFKDLKLFTEALEARYGKAAGVEDYARKAQALDLRRAARDVRGATAATSTRPPV